MRVSRSAIRLLGHGKGGPMPRNVSRRIPLAAIAGVLVAATAMGAQTGYAAAATPYPGETLDPSGISLVGLTPYQVRTINDQQAQAYSSAMDLAQRNPNDMGYPWLDTATNVLTFAPTTGRGESLAVAATTAATTGSVSRSIQPAQASIARLSNIADLVTRLNAKGVAHADLIWKTSPDEEHNRTIITVSALNSDLMSTLATSFGTNLIAVRIDPHKLMASSDTRSRDTSPFWGGANVYVPAGQCSTGFPWNVGGGVYGMLTAGHCAPTGGTVSNAAYYPNTWGTVTSGSEENWQTGSGTAYYNGQSTYRGDVSLIRIDHGATSQAEIYTNDGTTSRIVGAMSGWVGLGNSVCFSGNVTNYWCGMVTETGVNMWYAGDGVNVWARNVDDASAVGATCPTHGDSGGPVYQWRSDGRAIAQGILSGSAPEILACDMFFTDINNSYIALPGYLMVS